MGFGSKLEDIFCYAFGEPFKIVIGPHGRNNFGIRNAKKKAILNTVKAVLTVVKLLDGETEIDSSVINVINASLCSLNHILGRNKDLLELLSDDQLDTYKEAMHAISTKLADIQATLISDLDESVESIKTSRSYETPVEEDTDSDDE